MDGKYVFISYKVEEYDQALVVKKYLEANYIPCWMAPMSIRGGQSYAQEIPPAIHNCSAFVLILSEKAQQSKWVPREVDQAINAEKVILPYVIENCPLRSDFSFYLTNVQRYDAFREPEEALTRMMQDLQKILGITPPLPAEEPEPEIPAEPPKPKISKPKPSKKVKPAGKKKLPLILGGAVLLIALLVVLFLPRKATVAGTKFDLNAYSVTLENATLTQADVNQFSKFENLGIIRLDNCTMQAQNLNPMGCSSLMTLELKNCGITDAQFATLDLSAARYFNALDVSGNPDLTVLSGLEVRADSLKELNISDTGIRGFDWLASFSKLRAFHASRTELNDTALLEGMIYLEELSLSGNGLTALDGLKNTSKLTEVDLSHNSLADVTVLERSASTLTDLHLEGNALTDLSCLSSATGLKKVYIGENQLTDLNWLKHGENIQILSAPNNRIGSLSGLTLGSKLRCLDLSNNELNVIAEGDLILPEGISLTMGLSGNKLTVLQLPRNCTYKYLAILDNPELDLTQLSQNTGRHLFFDFPTDVPLQVLQDLSFDTLHIVGCPLDRQVEIEEGLRSEDLMTRQEALEEFAKRAANEDY